MYKVQCDTGHMIEIAKGLFIKSSFEYPDYVKVRN